MKERLLTLGGTRTLYHHIMTTVVIIIIIVVVVVRASYLLLCNLQGDSTGIISFKRHHDSL